MSEPRILIISHGHPDFSLGGGEIAAHAHWAELRRRGIEAMLVSRVSKSPGHAGATFLRDRRMGLNFVQPSTGQPFSTLTVAGAARLRGFSRLAGAVSPDYRSFSSLHLYGIGSRARSPQVCFGCSDRHDLARIPRHLQCPGADAQDQWVALPESGAARLPSVLPRHFSARFLHARIVR